jgi:hypothetical protein
MARDAVVVFQRYGIQPKFRFFRVALDVNVGRFMEKIVRVAEKPIRSIPKKLRHGDVGSQN